MTDATKAATERKRFSLTAWAKSMGYDRAIKAMTGNEVDLLRACLTSHMDADAKVREWTKKRQHARDMIDGFTKKLDAIKAASDGAAGT